MLKIFNNEHILQFGLFSSKEQQYFRK